MEAEPITLIDEEGHERTFWLHDAFQTGGFTYYLVEAKDDPELVLLLKEVSGALESVEDSEFDRVLAMLEGEEEGKDTAGSKESP